MIARAIKNKLVNPRYIYVAPTYGEAKRIAWDYFKMYTAQFPGVTVNEGELRIDIPLDKSGLNTIRFQLLGADRPSSLKGAYYDGVIFDEFAEMLPSAWTEAVRPALADRHTMDPAQGWAIFIGTPKGKNTFFDLYKRALSDLTGAWAAFLYKASETNIIPKSELDQMREEMSEDEYNQEMECSFEASNVGAYYGKEMAKAQSEGRIRIFNWEPSIPVHTAWDLGLDDYMSVWFYQEVWDEIRLIRYRQTEGDGFEQWAPYLFKETPYTYGTHFMPFDVSVRELSDGKDRKSKAEKLGIKPIEVAPKLGVMDGIHEVRSILHRCWFHEKDAADGITCLKEYSKKWDEKKKIFLETPNHNQFSHGADAKRVLALTLGKRREVKKDLPRRTISTYDKLNRRNSRV